jgi:tetratricopeptide (TPR) repeat protein
MSLAGSDTLLMLLDDSVWFLPRYLDTIGLRLHQSGRSEEAWKIWLSAGGDYGHTCQNSESLKRHAVFQHREDGSLHLLTIASESQQVEEALKVFREAAKMRELLVADGPNQRRFQILFFFYLLSWNLFTRKHFEVALDVTEGAVSIYRALFDEHPAINQADSVSDKDWVYRFYSTGTLSGLYMVQLPAAYPSKDPSWFQLQLVSVLDRVSVCCAELGKFERGLRAVEELVSIQRSRVAKQPDLRKSLASYLNNLCFFCQKTGNLEKLLSTGEELVSVHRSLAADEPDAFRTELASSLSVLSITYRETRDFVKGIVACEELVSLYRGLTVDQPDVYRSRLANSLNNLCSFCHETGNLKKELLAIEELVSVYRTLADDQPDVFQERLASLLNAMGWTLQELGRLDEALEVAQQSLEMTRAFTTETLDSQFALAAVLDTVAVCLQKIGRHEHAQQLGHESTVISRQIIETNPEEEEFWRSHLEHLENQIKPLESLNRTEEVHELMEEIATIKQRSHGFA